MTSNSSDTFMAQAIELAEKSDHPLTKAATIIVSNGVILATGLYTLLPSKIDIDCLSCAIANVAAHGVPPENPVVYTTRFPFSTPLYQAHLLGVTELFIQKHEWESYYKDEFRRASRLAKDLEIELTYVN